MQPASPGPLSSRKWESAVKRAEERASDGELAGPEIGSTGFEPIPVSRSLDKCSVNGFAQPAPYHPRVYGSFAATVASSQTAARIAGFGGQTQPAYNPRQRSDLKGGPLWTPRTNAPTSWKPSTIWRP